MPAMHNREEQGYSGSDGSWMSRIMGKGASAPKPKAKMLGSGGAAKAGKELEARGKRINKAIEEAGG